MKLARLIRTTPNPFKIPWMKEWTEKTLEKIEKFDLISIGTEESLEGIASAITLANTVKAYFEKKTVITTSLTEANIILPPPASSLTTFSPEAILEIYLSSLALSFSRTDLFNKTVVAVDLETAGYPQHEEEIVEIGAAKFKNGLLTDTYQSLVKPGKPITKDAYNIHGISNEEVQAHGKDPGKALEELAEFVGNSPMVGHNIKDFDLQILINNSARYAPHLQEFYSAKKGTLIDTLLLGRRYYPEAPSKRLGALASYLEIESDGRYHRALTDAIVSGEILYRMAFSYMLPSAKVGIKVPFEKWTFFDIAVPPIITALSGSLTRGFESGQITNWEALNEVMEDPARILMYSRYPNLSKYLKRIMCRKKTILPFLFPFNECPDSASERNRILFKKVLPELKRISTNNGIDKLTRLFNLKNSV